MSLMSECSVVVPAAAGRATDQDQAVGLEREPAQIVQIAHLSPIESTGIGFAAGKQAQHHVLEAAAGRYGHDAQLGLLTAEAREVDLAVVLRLAMLLRCPFPP